jgi:hypothetical protein
MTKMFDMADSSSRFHTAAELLSKEYQREGLIWVDPQDPLNRFVPLYEAKMISLFDHRASSYAARGAERGYRVLPETSAEDHADPDFEIEPFYWVSLDDFKHRVSAIPWSHPWLMGWKDVAAITNARTLTAAAFLSTAIGHTIRIIFVDGGRAPPAVILANLNALVLDYIARLKFGGLHLTVETLKQLPVLPPPSAYTESDLAYIVPRVLELTYTYHSMAPFVRDPATRGSPSAGTRIAGPGSAPSSTPTTPASTASPARNCSTSSTPAS